MYVYIAKDKELSRSNNFSPIYLKRDQKCLINHLPTQELIISVQLPSKGEKEPKPAQEQTKGMVSFLYVTYKAIHLLLAGDLSTDCFIVALQRFTSRQGNTRSIWSNNGQTFVGANRELKFLLKTLDQTAITNNLSIRNIQWHFIPPTSPWMGGTWETLVKVTKKALKSVTNNRQIREDQLITTLAQIEGTINNRPLTSISDDTEDLTVLTPNLFISKRSLNVQGVVDINEKKINSRRKWKVAEIYPIYIGNDLSKNIIKEYIPSLNVEKKWNKV